MGCCAPSALAVVHQLRVCCFFLDAALRTAFWHVGTRPFLPSIATTPRREAALCVLGSFDLSFSRVKLLHWWQELNVECLWLKMEAVCSK